MMPVFVVGGRVVPVFGRVWLVVTPQEVNPIDLHRAARSRSPPQAKSPRLSPIEFLQAAARRGLLDSHLPEDTPDDVAEWVQTLIFQAGDVAAGSVPSTAWATLYTTLTQTAAERYLQTLQRPDEYGGLVVCPEPCFETEQVLNRTTHCDVSLLVVAYRPPAYNPNWTVLWFANSDETWRVAYEENNVEIPPNQEHLFNV
jgi:hypothetical protein